MKISYPKRKYLKSITILFGMLLIFILVMFVSFYFSLQAVIGSTFITGFILGLVCYPLNEKFLNWISSVSDPFVDDLVVSAENSRKGFEGEDEVYSWFKETSEKKFLIRGATLPDRKFDFDLIYIGNKGLVVFEVKNLSNDVHFIGNEYYTRMDGEYIMLSPGKDPRHKLAKHVYALSRHLRDNNFDSIKIKKALVFSNGKVTWEGDPGVYIIKDKIGLIKYIKNLEIDSRFTPKVCEDMKLLFDKIS